MTEPSWRRMRGRAAYGKEAHLNFADGGDRDTFAIEIAIIVAAAVILPGLGLKFLIGLI